MTSAPSQVQTLFAEAVKNHTAGQLRAALGLYEQVIALDPLRAGVHYNRGVVLHGLGERAAALDSFDRAIALEPMSAQAHACRGDMLQALDRFEEAVLSYDRSLALNPAVADVHVNLGRALQKLQKYDRAIARYDAAIALRPNDAEAHNHRGIALQSLDRLDAALESYNRSAEIDPDFVDARCNAFWIHLALLKDPGMIARTGQEAVRVVIKRECEALSAQRAIVDFHLVHDLEQTDYLIANGYEFAGLQPANTTLRRVHERFRQQIEEGDTARNIPLTADETNDIIRLRSAFLRYEPPHVLDYYLHPETDWAAIEEQYFSSSPEIVAIDNFLAPRALEELRKFCLVSTVWKTDYPKQYLGALASAGFVSPLHVAIARDLQRRMPRIFAGHRFEQLWGFKFSPKMRAGLNVHADFARVNLNFWVTPDDANLDPTTGGLVVHDVPAPADWRFQDYNIDDQGIYAFLKRTGARSHRFPYRCNRAVLFNSSLFHETDAIHFKPGYENRRVNITYLFGIGLRTS